MNRKQIINHVAGLRKKVEPVDVDLTTLIARKSAYQDLRERYPAIIRSIDIFVVGFSMYSFGLLSGMGYVYGLRNGNKVILAIEEASGIMLSVAGMFLLAFVAALTGKVKRW